MPSFLLKIVFCAKNHHIYRIWPLFYYFPEFPISHRNFLKLPKMLLWPQYNSKIAVIIAGLDFCVLPYLTKNSNFFPAFFSNPSKLEPVNSPFIQSSVKTTNQDQNCDIDTTRFRSSFIKTPLKISVFWFHVCSRAKLIFVAHLFCFLLTRF